MLLGDKIGQGGSRAVYALPERPGYVVKIPTRNGRREPYNLYEYQVWLHAPDDLRQWLVPVDSCAADGSWLIMPRGESIEAADRPYFPHMAMHDWRKLANWVRIGDRVLLCDFAQRKILKALKIWPDDSYKTRIKKERSRRGSKQE